MVLTQEEIDQCREAFDRFDKDGSGSIDMWELRMVLQAMGQSPTEEELFAMISQVDDHGSGSIDFGEMLKVIDVQKQKMAERDDSQDTLDAFIAMGGNPDKTGQISSDRLRKTIKQFELTIDIEQLIAETDVDGSGFIDYEEFSKMLSDNAQAAQPAVASISQAKIDAF
mmetsp:Transcript_1642/g.3131  ORF Transcript_1642/g.3131 Transcript_1642/m.3131 type:complete len:169 (-) Transcript_1642:220-726(-)|eukprot:CAMPEP_0196657814 /NCGR_PEP_ID=MMETSP1086-20130531/25812_1 /TAXON_ID=77921 /ORGANISM="Cyanoptyche  gloeocystis , Strain SAG4.97" /LENGTH=168 /DNA_ID=CAMNT_0041991109 /DNA_START=53 /DNA_END=559 /DNA_ORIENTATION=-